MINSFQDVGNSLVCENAIADRNDMYTNFIGWCDLLINDQGAAEFGDDVYD